MDKSIQGKSRLQVLEGGRKPETKNRKFRVGKLFEEPPKPTTVERIKQFFKKREKHENK